MPPQDCVALDDHADRNNILTKREVGANKGSWPVGIATKGIHFGVAWIASSQVIRFVGSVIRKKFVVCVSP